MSESKYIIIDVRTKEEFKIRHLEEALNIPLSDIENGRVPDCSQDTKIFVHCASGARSERAKTVLESKGFTNIENTCNMDRTKSCLL